MKTKKKNKGITLIALVITIIILIILATISIMAVWGENGIITMAEKADELTDEATREEEEMEKAGINIIDSEIAGNRSKNEEIDGMVTVNIQDNNEVLINPGKGFVFYARRLTYDGKNLLNSVSPEILDMSEVVYTRFDWTEIQTSKDSYNFDLIDAAIADCKQYNKKFAFGVMCANSSSSERYVTPEFIFNEGAQFRESQNGQCIPDWEDEIFLTYLDKFIEALGEKYNGDPDIAFIDIRSYGNYGEQHLFGLNALDEEGNVDEDYTWKDRIEPDFLKEQYIRPYINAFPDTLLVIPWGEKKFNTVYEELIDEGVTLRRDGVITYTNGLDYCAKAYGKLPIVLEYAKSYGEYTKEQFNTQLEEAIKISKPSYIELDKKWYADDNQEYCKELANRLGYYFRLKKVSYKNEVAINEDAEIILDFKNDGITPIYEPCSVYIGLLDENNQLIKKYKTNINPKNWQPDIISNEKISINFNEINAGQYKLAVGLYKNDDDEKPTYLLGSEGKTEDKWYVFGEINLM